MKRIILSILFVFIIINVQSKESNTLKIHFVESTSCTTTFYYEGLNYTLEVSYEGDYCNRTSQVGTLYIEGQLTRIGEVTDFGVEFACGGTCFIAKIMNEKFTTNKIFI